MKFELADLPYDYNALEPFIGSETVRIHHQKHHGGYVSKLDKALSGNPLREKSLDEIVMASSGSTFNLAAQVWNHDFYWQSISPTAVTLADGALSDLVNQSFGSRDAFNEKFAAEAANEFGSGWAWLALNPDSKKLEVFSTTDAVNPMTSGRVPLLTLDVWEHAYYLDYQNRRGAYIDEFLRSHVNWAFAEKNLASA